MSKEQWWIFTFGCGQQHENHYVKIKGTYEEARDKMFELYGKEWALQYSEEEWNEWEKRRPIYIPAETELEMSGVSKEFLIGAMVTIVSQWENNVEGMPS